MISLNCTFFEFSLRLWRGQQVVKRKKQQMLHSIIWGLRFSLDMKVSVKIGGTNSNQIFFSCFSRNVPALLLLLMPCWLVNPFILWSMRDGVMLWWKERTGRALCVPFHTRLIGGCKVPFVTFHICRYLVEESD